MIGARASQRCELCRSESRHGQEASEQLRKKQWRTFKAKGVKLKRRASLGLTTGVGSIFSVPSPSMAREAKLNFEFIREDKDKQLESLWRETKIRNVLPWEDIADEAERLLAISNVNRNAANEGHDDGEQENDQEVERNETDYSEIVFGRRRPVSVVVEWTNKVLFVVEFKRKSHQRRDYRERGKSRAMAQHDILVRSLQKVAGDAKGENGGWKIKLIIFVGGTSG